MNHIWYVWNFVRNQEIFIVVTIRNNKMNKLLILTTLVLLLFIVCVLMLPMVLQDSNGNELILYRLNNNVNDELITLTHLNIIILCYLFF